MSELKRSALRYLVTIALVLCLSALLVNVVYAGITSNEHMSDTPYGPPVTQFPPGTTTVYVVFDYTDMQNEEITVKVWDPIRAEFLFERTEIYSGSGTESIEVRYPGGGAFPDGVYVTVFYKVVPYIMLPCGVGAVATPTPTPTDTPTPTERVPARKRQRVHLLRRQRLQPRLQKRAHPRRRQWRH